MSQTQTIVATQSGSPISRQARIGIRGELTAWLMSRCEAAGADGYVLTAIGFRDNEHTARIVASNWQFDVLELAGASLIARTATILGSAPGAKPTLLDCATLSSDNPFNAQERHFFLAAGCAELACVKVPVGTRALHLLLSAEDSGLIDVATLPELQMTLGYALSGVPELFEESASENPLSDRERECLTWVCEGKTTDEVALIVGVSPNTVNSYVTSTIRKLSAKSRAMAAATAIRSGII